jgi:hypothetical protein
VHVDPVDVDGRGDVAKDEQPAKHKTVFQRAR